MQGVKRSISRHELHSPGETNSISSLSKLLFSGGKGALPRYVLFLILYLFPNWLPFLKHLYYWQGVKSNLLFKSGRNISHSYPFKSTAPSVWTLSWNQSAKKPAHISTIWTLEISSKYDAVFFFCLFACLQYTVSCSIMLHFDKHRLGHVTEFMSKGLFCQCSRGTIFVQI